ncbi:sarcoplasmic calcium-binding protein-like [Mercenaria mercenaria]|uniref:sarcoplasmic calcium-binding protein-like n=1 Tax=Mercenaria mercenaria TaxID=6596 RepID=UPI00234FB5D9|nr:sarcoplasmic calcium-binding protein-like [Mercenaria mercenaria]XP_045214784.2 sarcoplasmic calcium-binding protein-like [Mercenaria mercenaria]XP_045214785.2 sarcoplasmic calcium-binding protein-like [Mercenaria mercenaria]XP_045214787.2 sarcoplasmic calcium-binding protein-like [Mercenaria mercenaria]XP_053393535.1 sarcoplasmic calcium-binding protein-like [Mercenaria mercenaria]
MASMMNEKWTIAFKLVDFNRDGVVNAKDKEDCMQSFLAVLKPDDGRKQVMIIQLNEFWDKIVYLTDDADWNKSFNLDEFISSRKEAYTKDSAKTISVVREALKQLISAGDIESSGSFSFEQFKNLHEAFNLKDDNLVKGIYSMVGSDGDGRCSVDSIAEFYTELAMGNDEGKHEQYKAALASVGFM